ncbi:MAG: universal stress protein [Lentimicrobium sp.]|jgi:nucleotide-binding universal stress UspA family protein|nr:universal stress protein [Lentimicrobium sp.]MDD2527157.1 universal stress protein [Lentimicrobiaceae bacterium]MDD4599297.1 universal stress protein [Lentimicrobiaceae bacterium]MDY0025737.1 universal stress protein [Lentimicrobium sp.]HAH57274.1 universal stress protein [Bacteroidales bacterium]
MKKVLIALDYDPSAQKIAEAGYALAQSMNAETMLLHVFAEPHYYATVGVSPITGLNDHLQVVPMILENMEDLKEEAKKYLDRTKAHLGGASIQTLVKEGEPDSAILDTAKAINADVIVLGSHSRRWIENILLGSVAEKVLKNTPVPLYIIPLKKKEEE